MYPYISSSSVECFVFWIVWLLARSNKNIIISQMFHKLQLSQIQCQNLTEDIILRFWIVSWGIIMNYVVGPSIQKWVHFTGSKAAILHISFLSLKPAKNILLWYNSVCFNSHFLVMESEMHKYYMHIFSVTMNHVFQCGKRKALFKLILGFKFQCIAMPPFPKKQVLFSWFFSYIF